MDHEEEQTDLDQVPMRLQEDGLPPATSPEEHQLHLRQQLLDTEAELQLSNQELHLLRSQQANEKKELESYVAHIRGLLQEHECRTAGFERENEQLQQELLRLRQQQEIQNRDLTEMLTQVDFGDTGLNSLSEQVAYLLVERATLLERLDAAEKTFDSQSFSGTSRGDYLQAHSEDLSRERNERQRLERDLDEASSRLAMAHEDIRRLNNELDVAKTSNLGKSDVMKLQRAQEQNDRLDAENRTLREKVSAEEREKKKLLDQLAKMETAQGDQVDKSVCSEPQKNGSAKQRDLTHERCEAAMEDRLVQLRELERQFQRLRKEHEELEERNEELEALLGEVQNVSKEERHRHEGELEGLHRRIKHLEGELKKQDGQEKLLKNREEVKTPESYLQLHLRDSSQERLALLEARLTEEKEWRKQLELDLNIAQAALKKDKEALQIAERELKKLKHEVNSLQTECQQGKTLIKSLSQVKGEKAVLEEKMAQMERAHRRLQSEMERHKDGDQTQEDLRTSRQQAEQLQQQAEQLTQELSSLQTAHDKLRDETVSGRQQTAELHAKLSASVQEKLTVDGEKDRLELEIHQLKEQLQWHQDQLCVTNEALRSKEETAHTHSTVIQLTSDKSLDQLSRQEVNRLQVKLTEERQLSSQHQLALQAQLSEAQAHIKSQDLVLSQKAEEAKQMKQDVQRAQGLFTSAERELRYEKEKTMDLKKHNTLLDNEKLKLCADLNQLQTKLVQLEKSATTQAADCERQQQRVRELELELARNCTNRSTTTSLQEDLQTERAQRSAADKKVLELQQQLKNAQHQLRIEEARASESSRLERDSRDLSDTLSALRAQQQEGHITRKLLEQREEELQQQVRSLRLKVASLTTANAELSLHGKQQDTRLSVLEDELTKAREEARNSQATSYSLKESLTASQQECEKLQGEHQQVHLQLDTQIRKYNEKQTQHKTKLRQAKQVFLKAITQRDSAIQKLENDLTLASSLSYKEKERIQKVMEENEKLLEEKRDLWQKMSEAEEMGSNERRAASTLQHRVNVLEEENRQLQDRTLKLSNEVSSLERSLRNAPSFSFETANKVLPSERLCESILHTSTLSLTSGGYDPRDFLNAICSSKLERVSDGTRASGSAQMPSEQGYLNLTTPFVSPDPKGTKESPSKSDDG